MRVDFTLPLIEHDGAPRFLRLGMKAWLSPAETSVCIQVSGSDAAVGPWADIAKLRFAAATPARAGARKVKKGRK